MKDFFFFFLILFECVLSVTLKELIQKGILIEKKPDLYIIQRKQVISFPTFHFSILIPNNLLSNIKENIVNFLAVLYYYVFIVI
jgi:hypothetical protein